MFLYTTHCKAATFSTSNPDLQPMDWNGLHVGHFDIDATSLQEINCVSR